MGWLQRGTVPPVPLPDPGASAFILSTWGPEFAWQFWHWGQSLQRLEGPARPQAAGTTLKLFCDFVATTAALPPLVFTGPDEKRVGSRFLAQCHFQSPPQIWVMLRPQYSVRDTPTEHGSTLGVRATAQRTEVARATGVSFFFCYVHAMAEMGAAQCSLTPGPWARTLER